MDTDQDLVTGRFGRGRFLIAKDRWFAELMDSDCFHSAFSTNISKNGNTRVVTWVTS